MRRSWPDDIDWVFARDAIEHLGRDELLKRSLRWGWGSPVKIRNNLRRALRLTRELQAVINALPAPLLGSSPDPILKSRFGGSKTRFRATSILPERRFVGAATHIVITLSIFSLGSGKVP